MTDTKLTLEEQIEYQQRKLQDNQVNPVVTLMNSAIIASLKELAALRGRLMEPDEEMRKFARTLLSMSTVKTEADAVMLFKAMSAVALKIGRAHV